MLTKYQSNLIGYFRDNSQYFTSYLLANIKNEYTIFTEIEEHVVFWLDLALKKELDLYSPNSIGHTRITDMLIELHARRNDELKNALMIALSKTYNQ